MKPNNMANASATAKGVLSTAASYAATGMLFRSIARDMIPRELYNIDMISKIFSLFSNELTMMIHEKDGLVNNEIYEAVELYLSRKLSPSTTDQRLISVSKQRGDKDFKLKMENDEVIIDTFNNVKFRWVFLCRVKKTTTRSNVSSVQVSSELRSFSVTYPKKYKEMALESYLPYILKEANSILQKKKILKIFTMCSYSGGRWTPIKLDHPATFNTIAIDADLKNRILKDLDRFVKRKVYYRNAGKVWRRGYLLYGPPGTGKSSLIAAIANYLNFDVYDLELTQIRSNSDLKRVLLATSNRSILVVEDIDCTIQLNNRLTSAPNPLRPNSNSDKVTLSGFLNFIDGLWSSCGDGRIIIFTTNHKEKLDPALLRPGRMDFHIHMSYCTPPGFRVLASNYLGGIKDHVLFREIEDLISTIQVTPADIAEQLMRSDEVDTVLNDLIQFLRLKKKQNEEDDQEEAAAAKKIKGDPELVVKVEAEQGAKPDGKDDVKANDGTMGEANDDIGKEEENDDIGEEEEEEDHMDEEEEEEEAEANAYIVEEEVEEYDSESSADE